MTRNLNFSNTYPKTMKTGRNAINSMNFANVSDNDNNYFIKTKLKEDAINILKVFKIKLPKNVSKLEDMSF